MAFSAFTDFGAVMALAIAVHNIPEGVIVAAPVFAATGSRWKAMGIAVASVRSILVSQASEYWLLILRLPPPSIHLCMPHCFCKTYWFSVPTSLSLHPNTEHFAGYNSGHEDIGRVLRGYCGVAGSGSKT